MFGVATVKLRFPGIGAVVQHPLAVVPNDAMPYCMILGVDFLVSQSLEIDYATGTLRQGEHIIHHFSTLSSGGARSVNLSFSIPPYLLR